MLTCSVTDSSLPLTCSHILLSSYSHRHWTNVFTGLMSSDVCSWSTDTQQTTLLTTGFQSARGHNLYVGWWWCSFLDENKYVSARSSETNQEGKHLRFMATTPPCLVTIAPLHLFCRCNDCYNLCNTIVTSHVTHLASLLDYTLYVLHQEHVVRRRNQEPSPGPTPLY